MLKNGRYRIYVLRLWPVQRGGIPGWHISLEDVTTGQCKQFPSLQDLFQFLEDELSEIRLQWEEVKGV